MTTKDQIAEYVSPTFGEALSAAFYTIGAPEQDINVEFYRDDVDRQAWRITLGAYTVFITLTDAFSYTTQVHYAS